MTYLIVPLILITLIFIFDLIFKKRQAFKTYLFIFTVSLGLELFFPSTKAHATESYNASYYGNIIFDHHIQKQDFIAKLNNQQFTDYANKAQYHMLQGQRCYREANELVLLIPDFNDRQIAEHLFRAAIITSIGEGFPGAVAGLLYLLTEYSINVHQQWCKMESLLLESKYHFEMNEFYIQLIADNA